MKNKFIALFLLFAFASCKTYTISTENFKNQFTSYEKTVLNQVEINNPLLFGNIKYNANDIKFLEVIDKSGKPKIIPNSPALEMKVTHVNGKKYHFYFDTVVLENNILRGSRSRFISSLKREIPFDSIVKIEVQDGGKNFNYQK